MTNRYPEHGEQDMKEDTDDVYEQRGMRTINQLIDFIQNMPEDMTSVLIDSKTFGLEIPIGEKDVVCMKVLRLIEDEYGGHTVGDAIEILQDTIWWLTTFMVAFPPDNAHDDIKEESGE